MNHGVPSVDASIRLISLVAAGDGSGPIQTVARRLSITNSSCFRILRTLKQAGWVSEKASSDRSIGPALLQLARSDDVEGRLIAAARESIRSLALETGLACKLSARRGDQAVTLHRAEPASPVSITSPAGAMFTLCLGSSGAVLASEFSTAELEQLIAEPNTSTAWKHQSIASFRLRVAHAKRHGWAIDQGSYHPSIQSISHVVRTGTGQIIAAVTLLGMAGDLEPVRLRKLRPLLKRCTDAVAASFKNNTITQASRGS